MTDTTKVPEKIWAVFEPHYVKGQEPYVHASASPTRGKKYIRADHVSVLIAAAYEGAAIAAKPVTVQEASRESDAEIKRLRGALEDIAEGEPEWPNDPAKELEWCRNRALAAYQKDQTNG